MLDSEILHTLMHRALLLAKKAYEEDEVPIGALIYSSQQGILGEGYNKTIQSNDPTAHAEVIAIRNACAKVQNYRLNSCYLICTIEPCFACLGTILNARITGVVYGASEQKTGALTHSIIPKHLQSHLQYRYSGILEEECRELMQMFFRGKR